MGLIKDWDGKEKKNTMEDDIDFKDLIDILKDQEQKMNSGGSRKIYLYRGQSTTGYHLQPSALREPGMTQLEALHTAIDGGQTELLEEIFGDTGCLSQDFINNPMNQAMRLFHVMANRRGLDVPSENSEGTFFKDKVSFIPFSSSVDKTTFGAYINLQAIAQHYHFPTFLLDWSLDPLCALYFAVRGALEKLARSKDCSSLKDERFSFWFLRADPFISDEYKKNEKNDDRIKIYSCNHYSNLNQIAQRGVFTYVCRNDLNDTRTILDIVDGKEAIDEPLVTRYNIRYDEVLVAMDYLKRRFKTSDVFFPGYEGIVMAMKDHANYQIVKQRKENEL